MAMHKTVGDSITLAFLTALLAGLFPATRVAADDTDLQFFETEIRPLLTEHCQECHGPAKQESSLRLDSRSAILQGGDRGPAIVPGQPDLSLLMAAVRQTGDLQMPPDRHLNTGQIDRLAHWIHRALHGLPTQPFRPTSEPSCSGDTGHSSPSAIRPCPPSRMKLGSRLQSTASSCLDSNRPACRPPRQPNDVRSFVESPTI